MIVACACIFQTAFAQETIDKEVRVVKPYEPTLSGARKIGVLPVLDDTLQLAPNFDYRIFPQPLQSRHEVRPIQSARLEPDPLPELYGAYLRLGFGNYVTPLAELSMNSLRKRTHSLALNVSHISSQGKVKLENDQKVFAGYSDTRIDLNGKRIFKNNVWSGNLGFDSQTRYFYGHRPDTIAETEKEDVRQRYLMADMGTSFKSTHGDSSRLNYALAIDYGYTQDLFNYNQHAFLFEGTGFRSALKGVAGADIMAGYYRKTVSPDSADNILVSVHPWWMRNTSEYQLRVGMDITADIQEETTMHFYPNAMLRFRVIERILIPYVGLRGYVTANDYRTIAMENPFIMPGLSVRNTDNKMEFYGGIKGNLGSSTAFTLRASYTLADGMHLFVNDTLTLLSNQFDVVYDDVELVSYYGELMFNINEKWDILIKGNYNQYTTAVEEKAWHKFLYDATLSAKYNLRNKIIVSADILGFGPRWAKTYGTDPGFVKLEGFFDANLALEYRYSKILSGFVSLKNIAYSKYQVWNQYPAQGFFVLFGFTYSL